MSNKTPRYINAEEIANAIAGIMAGVSNKFAFHGDETDQEYLDRVLPQRASCDCGLPGCPNGEIKPSILHEGALEMGEKRMDERMKLNPSQHEAEAGMIMETFKAIEILKANIGKIGGITLVLAAKGPESPLIDGDCDACIQMVHVASLCGIHNDAMKQHMREMSR